MARKPAEAESASHPLSAKTRVGVLIGDDPFLAREMLVKLRADLTAAHGEIDASRVEGSQTTIAHVLDECRTFGLMVTHKLIQVDNAEALIKEEARAALERYCQSPSPSATLILRCSRWYKGKLDDIIRAMPDAGGSLLSLTEITPDMALNWAIKRAAKRYNATVAKPAAELLIAKLGTELGRIDTELDKLATYALALHKDRTGSFPTDPVTIAPEMVSEMVGLTREDEAWGLQSTLLTGDARAALSHLKIILGNSRKDAAVPAMWATLELARKLHGASRGLRQGDNEFALAGKLKIWGPAKDAIMAAAKRADPRVMAEVLRACVDADHRSKTGLGDMERHLERLAVRFSHALKR
jgi:DNA polymerase III subunit delta